MVTQPAMLILIGNNESKLGAVSAGNSRQTRHAGNVWGSRRIRVLGHKRHLLMAINPAAAQQPLMSNPGLQLHGNKVAPIHAVL